MKKIITALMVVVGGVAFNMMAVPALLAESSLTEEQKKIAQGKSLAFNRKKGNCLACHQIQGGTLAGTVGPPLVQMKIRFPDKNRLRNQIWDSTAKNPNTMMPPFGRHHILTDQEVDLITDYVHSL